MPLLTLDGVRKSYGVRPLLADASLVIEADEKVGVIGVNGAGKTTLLRIAAGVEPPDGGRVIRHGASRVGFLPQRPDLDDSQTVLQAVLAGDGEAMRVLRDYDAAAHTAESTEDVERVMALAARIDALGAWGLDSEARALLDRLGLPDAHAPVATLSGGQRKRVALARALVEQPDLLILDEPTNHLDAETVEWLEATLAKFTGALLLVTHDRYVLERVTNRMVEVEKGTLTRYIGRYSDYLEQKADQTVVKEAEAQKTAQLAKRELAWLRRGAKARTTKQKARVDRATTLISAPKDGPEAAIEIASASTRLGTKVVEVVGVTKGFDRPDGGGHRVLVRDFTYLFTRQDRVGIIGPNGAGKTTLLEMIAGRLAPDAGTVSRGPTVSVGYYDQESRALDDDVRLIDYISAVAENVKTADGSVITAGQMLERFLFPGPQQYTPVGLLSGGERRRLYLLRILMGAPNVLLLDEPTNDLDIPTLVALEEYLDSFAGCVIVVSHDRHFLDRTAEHLFRFEPDGTLRESMGGYSAYLEGRADRAAELAAETARTARPKPIAPIPAQAAPADRRMSYGEKRELGEVEARIAAGEARQVEIEALLASGPNAATAVALSTELGSLAVALNADMERWAELAEMA